MKRLLSATLALTLLGATAASAQPYHRGGGHHRSHQGGNTAALVGLSFGLLALGAIAASSQRDRYYGGRYYDRYDYGPPPPRYRYRNSRYGYRY